MSGNTGTSVASSNGGGTNADASGQNVTPPIRDFIYLNQDRIYSYLSQLDGGLKLLYSKVKEESWSETMTTPELTSEVTGSLAGSFEGKIPLLAGMSAEATAEWVRSRKTGNDARVDGERITTSDLFGLHHRAFDLVIERLGSRVKTVSGQIMLADINWLQQNIKDFPEIIKNVNMFLPQKDKITPPDKTSQMSYLFKTYLMNRILMILRDNNSMTYTSYLDPKHLTYPLDNIISDYGQTPTIEFTLVGIEATPQQFSQAGKFEVPHFHSDAQPMAKLFGNFAGNMQNMRDFFEMKSREGHMVPLALYTEI